MYVAALAAAAFINWADASPVPGQCAEPAADNRGKAGCFLIAEMSLGVRQVPVWWHLYEFPSEREATDAASKVPNALSAVSHGKAWLHILAGAKAPSLGAGAIHRATVGPLVTPGSGALVARFMESIFTPGMRTRVHSHPGPEAFYVIEGEQCLETPATHAKLRPGETFIVPPGSHVQAAAKGRKNILLVLHREGSAWMTMTPEWKPSQYCAD
jgi:quercetin dioxygenase-like cupin family protein